MYRLIQLKVVNRPGVLHRITQVVLKPHYNIDSLSLIATEDPKVSIITIGVRMPADTAEEQARLLTLTLEKQVDVISALDMTSLETHF